MAPSHKKKGCVFEYDGLICMHKNVWPKLASDGTLKSKVDLAGVTLYDCTLAVKLFDHFSFKRWTTHTIVTSPNRYTAATRK